MAVQHNVINGICAGCKYRFCESHSLAMASASGNDGRVRGRPRGVRNVRLSSVTVCQEDSCVLLSLLLLSKGFNRADHDDGLDMVVFTPVALCVPSTPAEIGDCTTFVESSLLVDDEDDDA